jgi:glycine oxidase
MQVVFSATGSIGSGPPAPPPLPRPRAVEDSAAVDVAIVGAGVIGLSIAWRLALRGLTTAVFERATAGAGASLAATGMLAAAAEHEPGCHDLLALALDSQRQWPQFRAALEAQSAGDIDFRRSGTLVVALSRDEVERLRFRYDLHKRCGLPTRFIGGPEVRALEPALRPSVAAALSCADDHQVDPRLVMAALRAAYIAAGGRLLEHCAVTAVDLEGGRVAGLATANGGCRARTVVLTAGAWTGDLLPPGLIVPVRPLKGQALAVRTTGDTGTLAHVVWTEQIHMAPKGDGRLIVGATVEERGFDDAVTAGGLFALLEGARRAFPGTEEMAIEAVWTGFRPSSIDDAPILGPTSIPGLVLATGHHRNGYLLAPATAFAIEALIADGALPVLAQPFGLDRFDLAAAHRQAAPPFFAHPSPNPASPACGGGLGRQETRQGAEYETGMLA